MERMDCREVDQLSEIFSRRETERKMDGYWTWVESLRGR